MASHRGLLLVVLTVLGSLLLGCEAQATTPAVVSISALVEDPEAYEGETITVEGSITEALGERSYFLVYIYPQYNPITKQIVPKMSLSQVKVSSWLFSDGEELIEVTQKKGGLYLPLPVLLTSSPELPTERISLTGEWRRTQEGEYVLHIEKIEEERQ